MIALPIDALIPQLLASLQTHPNLIIEATPGAGKTTRIPPALLVPEIAGKGEVWVLEPRRIAARLSARRVADEMGENLGETVGYQVRFEEVGSARTRLRFLTEGVLTRRLLSNPTLKGVAVVVLDEFHERHLQTDLALALLRHLQTTTRPDLKIIVMSATLNAEPLATYLGACPILRSEGRRFEVTITYQREYDARPLAEQVASTVRNVVTAQPTGDVLVFLPGAAEIKRAQTACTDFARQHHLLVLPLHGELSASEQDVALRLAPKRKVILSTNVAETSVTIEGVTAVIDSGLARIAEHSPWSGLPTLNVKRISQASAIQRAGRAGRTQAGQCWRLYGEMDYATRAAFETPEIQRLDLASAALDLHAFQPHNLAQIAWYEAPPAQAIEAAEILLRKLGAIGTDGEITELGKQMARFPLHPRQSRVLLEAVRRGLPERGARVASLLGERDLRARNFSTPSEKSVSSATSDSDLFEQERLYLHAEEMKFDAERLWRDGISSGAVLAIRRSQQQLLRLLGQPASDNVTNGGDADRQIRIAILAGYPDRIGKQLASDNGRRGGQAGDGAKESLLTLQLVNGATMLLSPYSTVRAAMFLVGIDVDEKQAQRSSTTLLRTASAIEPDWLLDLFPDDVHEMLTVEWNDVKERAEVFAQICYGRLVLDESRLTEKQVSMEARQQMSRVLQEAVAKKGWEIFLDETAIARLIARLYWAAQHFPEMTLPAISASDIDSFVQSSCSGKSSFGELRESLTPDVVFQAILSYDQLSWLNRVAPEHINIARRKNLRIHYEMDRPPWIASRMQDFFGMQTTPTIGQGRIPLVLQLLAPNQRPVQVTADLAGFWTRMYPQVRRELSRRYPKHAWPENPLHPASKAT